MNQAIPTSLLLRGRMPAEFEPFGAILLGFDWSLRDWWPGTLCQIAKAIHKRIQVFVTVPDGAAQSLLTQAFIAKGIPLEQLRFIQLPIRSVWARDYVPAQIRLLNGEWSFVDAFYCPTTGHGNSSDGQLTPMFARTFELPSAVTRICLDNRNLLTNGQGLVICTEDLLQKNARCGYDEDHVTSTLLRLFNATDVIYLESLHGETARQVDRFATFTAPDTIVVSHGEESDRWNTSILNRNAERLANVYTDSGPLRVVRVPMPAASDSIRGSYTNVLFANGVLLVPTWQNVDRTHEDQVFSMYRDLLPEWQIVGIDATRLGRHGGGLRSVGSQLNRVDVPFWEIVCDGRAMALAH